MRQLPTKETKIHLGGPGKPKTALIDLPYLDRQGQFTTYLCGKSKLYMLVTRSVLRLQFFPEKSKEPCTPVNLERVSNI